VAPSRCCLCGLPQPTSTAGSRKRKPSATEEPRHRNSILSPFRRSRNVPPNRATLVRRSGRLARLEASHRPLDKRSTGPPGWRCDTVRPWAFTAQPTSSPGELRLPYLVSPDRPVLQPRLTDLTCGPVPRSHRKCGEPRNRALDRRCSACTLAYKGRGLARIAGKIHRRHPMCAVAVGRQETFAGRRSPIPLRPCPWSLLPTSSLMVLALARRGVTGPPECRSTPSCVTSRETAGPTFPPRSVSGHPRRPSRRCRKRQAVCDWGAYPIALLNSKRPPWALVLRLLTVVHLFSPIG